jgi:hypothetical protein
MDIQLVQACCSQCPVRRAGHLHFVDQQQQHADCRIVLADFVS